MTDQEKPDLELLERLNIEATPAPWRAGRSDMTSYDANTGEAFKNVYGPNYEPKLHHGERIPLEEARGIGERCHPNAQLIAAARNALPSLLTKAREHEAMVALLRWAATGDNHVYYSDYVRLWVATWAMASEEAKTAVELATKLGLLKSTSEQGGG